MTLLPTTYINADDDWIESLRRYWWPRLERVWPLATITIQDDEYVCTVELDEQALEEELESVGFVRNPIAGLKQHADGERVCEGSWCLLPSKYDERSSSTPRDEASTSRGDPTGRLKPSEQLHVNVFETPKGVEGTLELFAHAETDWRDDPYGHLTHGTQLKRGEDILLEVLREHSYLDINRISEG